MCHAYIIITSDVTTVTEYMYIVTCLTERYLTHAPSEVDNKLHSSCANDNAIHELSILNNTCML